MARTFRLATGTNPDRVKGSHGRVDADPKNWGVLVTDQPLALPAAVAAVDFLAVVRQRLAKIEN